MREKREQKMKSNLTNQFFDKLKTVHAKK